ncbi:MAG: smalltalk protein [Bacteroidaceae bacterium]|nr:smalltalk protein [Bacteroidaceae bacterium]
MDKKAIWSKVIQLVITILTAVATTFGMQSCL